MTGPILSGSPFQRYSAATVNVVCDGNSLTQGVGALSSPYPSQLGAMDPLKGLVNVTNLGVSGQTTGQMTSAATDVDGAWVSGKTNILIAWEGTNSITGGQRTAAQAAQEMTDYIAARQAVQPWIVVLMTCLPRQAGTEAASATLNATLDAYNALLKANYKTMGARAIVDVRQAGGPFAFADYLDATFTAAAATGLWASGESPHVHLSGAGYFKVAQMVAAVLKRLPRR
jgi:lysophospholipase L1-like esterase